MQTIRTISNISYNSDAYFRSVIERMESDGIIDWAYWIRHKADTDDTKDHIHFVMKPSERVDLNKLGRLFYEIGPDNPLPLGVTKKWFFTNSMDDWLLYAVHDYAYLQSKGLHRNVHYAYSDLQATDYDALRADWNAIDRIKYDRTQILIDAITNGIPFAVLVQIGVVPIAQRAQYEQQYTALFALMKSPKTRAMLMGEVDLFAPKTDEIEVIDNGDI